MNLIKTMLIAILSLLFTPAAAQQVCGPFNAIDSKLTSEYGESRLLGYMISSTQLIYVYTNTETGTVTVILLEANGQSCLVSAGNNLIMFNELPEPKGEDM